MIIRTECLLWEKCSDDRLWPTTVVEAPQGAGAEVDGVDVLHVAPPEGDDEPGVWCVLMAKLM